ncbi:hypothetical protein KCP77_18515 [Salmonella enterica subsp. enterica]|nr:hypothetical protein KCP77_18515 [Salmonella enterica subsp. enterica]
MWFITPAMSLFMKSAHRYASHTLRLPTGAAAAAGAGRLCGAQDDALEYYAPANRRYGERFQRSTSMHYWHRFGFHATVLTQKNAAKMVRGSDLITQNEASCAS